MIRTGVKLISVNDDEREMGLHSYNVQFSVHGIGKKGPCTEIFEGIVCQPKTLMCILSYIVWNIWEIRYKWSVLSHIEFRPEDIYLLYKRVGYMRKWCDVDRQMVYHFMPLYLRWLILSSFNVWRSMALINDITTTKYFFCKRYHHPIIETA